ncbi:MAG: hypothetical protein D6740_06040, partial [Alphaproteobacteria bacterium]
MWDVMLSRLRMILGGEEESTDDADEADLALACLLMEAAAADGRIAETERKMIATLLVRRGQTPEEAARLMRRAEELVSD